MAPQGMVESPRTLERAVRQLLRDHHEREQRRAGLDRELDLGHRRRHPARPLRARQVPGRPPADDRAAPARAVLEGSKETVVEMKANLNHGGVVEQDVALRRAAGQPFYNTPVSHRGLFVPAPILAAHRRLPGLSRRVLAQRAGTLIEKLTLPESI